MARMRDTKNYNPYKRCKMAVYILPNASGEERARARFCKTHMKKCIYGTVDHVVEEGSKLYDYYKKKNPNIDEEIEAGLVTNGTYSQFSTDDFEAVLRKIQKQNSKKQRIEIMSHANQLSFMEKTMSIADLPQHISRDKPSKDVALEWKKYLVQHNKWLLTIREGEQLLEFLVGLIDSNQRPPKSSPKCESTNDEATETHSHSDNDDCDDEKEEHKVASKGPLDGSDSDEEESEDEEEIKKPVKKTPAKKEVKEKTSNKKSVKTDEEEKKETKKASKKKSKDTTDDEEPVKVEATVVSKKKADKSDKVTDKSENVESEPVEKPAKTAEKSINGSMTIDEMQECIENDDARQITVSKHNNRESFYMVTNKGKNKNINPYVLFYLYKKDNTYCPVGFVRDWIDTSDEIPDRFKNSCQAVLDPESRIPIVEVELNARGAMMTPLSKGIYREYDYDESASDLEYTGNVQLN
jgi:hypothetical protein